MWKGKKSEADWAVEVLREKKEPMYYFDLISKIAEKMGKNPDSANLTSIYTRLNLDNRLVYQGEGYWYYDSNRIREEG
ncbi:MAG: DNA-directed RNA polymerase subunit delta [Syntrophomonadaceae bacterium]|nr:DNA-directed RNA polymerase subunit delta [Syntrophomonadaceae bacterium]